MLKQTLIVGLGQFGMSLARALAEHGGDVIAVDVDPGHIAEIAPHVADAVVMDAMDEESLAKLGPSRRDACICAIGDENREGSIIVTALLKQLGAPRIIARATDPLHARILDLVGADEVVSPERDFGHRLALRLAWRNVLNVMPLGGELVMTELAAPESFWGRTLMELQLPKRYTVNVAAVRRETPEGKKTATIPKASDPLQKGDTLVVVSTAADVRKLTEKS